MVKTGPRSPTKQLPAFLGKGLAPKDRELVDQVKANLHNMNRIPTAKGSGFKKCLGKIIEVMMQRNINWTSMTPRKQYLTTPKYKALYDYVY